jgi:hypothetical protein
MEELFPFSRFFFFSCYIFAHVVLINCLRLCFQMRQNSSVFFFIPLIVFLMMYSQQAAVACGFFLGESNTRSRRDIIT